jgi:hypothetical protein
MQRHRLIVVPASLSQAGAGARCVDDRGEYWLELVIALAQWVYAAGIYATLVFPSARLGAVAVGWAACYGRWRWGSARRKAVTPFSYRAVCFVWRITDVVHRLLRFWLFWHQNLRVGEPDRVA